MIRRCICGGCDLRYSISLLKPIWPERGH